MGGLYFWVCKMKPDAPALGCTSLQNRSPYPLMVNFSLYRMDLYDSNDTDRNIGKLEARTVQQHSH
jgi:hypothetical protein